LKCPLCPKLGGAMRPTLMSMKDSIFELINPTFHTYAINYKVDRQSNKLIYFRASSRW